MRNPRPLPETSGRTDRICGETNGIFSKIVGISEKTDGILGRIGGTSERIERISDRTAKDCNKTSSQARVQIKSNRTGMTFAPTEKMSGRMAVISPRINRIAGKIGRTSARIVEIAMPIDKISTKTGWSARREWSVLSGLSGRIANHFSRSHQQRGFLGQTREPLIHVHQDVSQRDPARTER